MSLLLQANIFSYRSGTFVSVCILYYLNIIDDFLNYLALFFVKD